MRWTNIWRVMLIIRLNYGKAWGRLYLHIQCKVLGANLVSRQTSAKHQSAGSKRMRPSTGITLYLIFYSPAAVFVMEEEDVSRQHKISLTLKFPQTAQHASWCPHVIVGHFKCCPNKLSSPSDYFLMKFDPTFPKHIFWPPPPLRPPKTESCSHLTETKGVLLMWRPKTHGAFLLVSFAFQTFTV